MGRPQKEGEPEDLPIPYTLIIAFGIKAMG